MAASCFSTPLSVRPASPAFTLRSPARAVRPGLGQLAPAVGPLVLALVLAAALLAPEQPVAQGGICQRHNGVAACRVW